MSGSSGCDAMTGCRGQLLYAASDTQSRSPPHRHRNRGLKHIASPQNRLWQLILRRGHGASSRSSRSVILGTGRPSRPAAVGAVPRIAFKSGSATLGGIPAQVSQSRAAYRDNCSGCANELLRVIVWRAGRSAGSGRTGHEGCEQEKHGAGACFARSWPPSAGGAEHGTVISAMFEVFDGPAEPDGRALAGGGAPAD
jgi:hypothetical protein